MVASQDKAWASGDATRATQDAPTTVNGEHGRADTPIAVVGMACRFAGDATTPQKLWDLCASGRDAWSGIPEERFDVKSLYHADSERPGRNHAVGGYFLQEDVALFDAGFFNLPSDVASVMDPQVRLLLEIVYEATEDAGIPVEKLAGSNTSVFSGCYGKDYHDLQTRDPEAMRPSFLTGNYTAMLSNRISHFYDLQGASMSIDTGCSSGLAALHQACQTIRSGESDVSIVGASSTILNPDLFIAMSTLGMTGADGRCYAWDTRAEGYGRGEGVAALVLKSLDAALRDGDQIHTVIRTTGLNQDGRTKTITSPSVDAQVRLIQDCYRRVGLDPADTGYIEAHMTGTQTGDAAEAEALALSFGRSRAAATRDPVLVTGVKTNIGHTEPVSGLAAIIKTAFAMKNRLIAPNLNYATGNPKIPLDEWHLQVPTALAPWPEDMKLRASINNFGYGGSNAHVILEAAPERPSASLTNGNGSHDAGAGTHRVYTLSAKDSAAAKVAARNLAAHLRQCLERGEEPSPRDLAYTLAERRSRLPWVASVTAPDLATLADRLDAPALRPSRVAAKTPRVAFVFNGQGAQWHAMGRELLAAYPVFAAAVDEADRTLRDIGADWSLYDELMRDEASSRVSEIHLSQPITVALQICLVVLLRSWGVTPSAVTSHSSGEIAAAYTVGLLSLREALGVVYYRGELARKHQNLAGDTTGGMLAAGVGPAEAGTYLANTAAGGRVVVACVNSPESVTLSGDLPDLEEVAARLEKDGRFARRLKVPLAYHSHHMLSMAPEYTERLRAILPSKPSWKGGVVFASPVTGDIVTSPGILTPEHWARNLTSPVLFSDAFEAMCFGADPEGPASVDMVVEVGPHSTLAGPIRQILHGRKLEYASCLQRKKNAVETMQNLACELLGRGYTVSLGAVNNPLGAHEEFVPGLPTYPWNHSTRYWVESRVNKELRHKRFPPHELLGLPVSGGNPLVPTWRNFLRLSDVPWLADHKVDSEVVLPGAAYIAAAIEAVRLLTDASEENTAAYRVRDVEFLNALTISESSSSGGIETLLRLQPCSHQVQDADVWYDFEFSFLSPGDVWVQNCRGAVSAVVKGAVDDHTIPGELPDADSFLDIGSTVRDFNAAAQLDFAREMSIEYGPAFRNLTDGFVADNRAVTNLRIGDAAQVSEAYVVHPTTLDCIIQATYTSLPPETSRKSMVLPRSIQSMFIPRGLNRQGGDKLRVLSELQKSAEKGFTSAVWAQNHAKGNVISPPSALQIENLFCQAVPRATESTTGLETLCSKSRWEPDILHNIPSAVKDSMRITLNDDEADFEKKMLRAAYYLICDAVAKLEPTEKEKWEWHHKIMYDWMRAMVKLGESGELSPGSKTWGRASKGVRQKLVDELKSGEASGRLTVRVGQKLVEILCGTVTPLELMMEGNLLSQYYMELPKLKARTYKHLAALAELFIVKNPGAKVLEIGGGTGGATRVVLDAFSARGNGSGSLLGHYTFTDVSSGFFEAARQTLADWEGLVEFKRLDIEADPIQQLSPDAEGSYDLIVASMVLHATKNLKQTMTNVRRLLKPGGKLLLIETTRDRLDMQLIFGTLPGWWLSEEPTRKMSPNVSLERWDEVLRETRFTGVEFDVGDCEQAQYQCSSVILSSAAAVTAPAWPSSVSIVYASQSPPQPWLAQLSKRIMATIGVAVDVETLGEVQAANNKGYIFTEDMVRPFLHGADKTAFSKLQQLLVRGSSILWLSRGGSLDAGAPEFALTQGLLRTLRQEDAGKRCIQLDFEQDPDGPWTEDKIDHIVRVLQETFDEGIEIDSIDWEYAVKDSVLHVPRVYPDEIEDWAPRGELQAFQHPQRRLVWETSSRRSAGAVHFTPDTSYDDNEIPGSMIEVEPKAFHLTAAQGQHNPDGDLVAYELAGIVTRLGHDTGESGLQVGDRVCGISKGHFASTARSQWTSVAKIASSMSFEQAACIPIAYATAYHSLIQVARLQRGESVLVHGAADRLGQAAAVIAQQVGAQVFATCSTEAQQQLLVSTYNLSPDHVLLSGQNEKKFKASIMHHTNHRGVDVVLNSVVGPPFKATWECIARFGRFVELNRPDPSTGQRLEPPPFDRCATYSVVDILQLAEYNGRLMKEALEGSIHMCHDTPHTLPLTQFSISQLDVALSRVQQETRAGGVIVVPREGELVNVISGSRPLSLDNPNATYLIVGGVGGIGRAVAAWMLTKEAKNILIISRSAEAHPEAADLVREAEKAGCTLQIRSCDVSSEESLVELLKGVAESMPQIGGVVNAAMVLEDAVLEHMTFDQWQRAVQPKVAGTTNLHRHLPSNMSFFVSLSSLTGVAGHLSQANYSAGNTFQDALARHRAAEGLPATSIDLSAVEGVGYVEEQRGGDGGAARSRIEALGSTSVSVDVVLRLLEKVILQGGSKKKSPADSQVIVGLLPWSRLPPDATIRRDRRFGTLRLADPRSSAASAAAAASSAPREAMTPTALLVEALNATPEHQVQMFVEAVVARMVVIFNVRADEVDLDAPVAAHGVDSLVAVELRNWLATTGKIKVSIFEIIQSASLRELAKLLVERSKE